MSRAQARAIADTTESRATTGPPPTFKRFRFGTHRTRTPEETWAWIVDRLPRVGITRVADVTGLDGLGVPVYQAIRPRSRSLTVSQGKALSPTAAKVSAVMESIELWHAECLDTVPHAELSIREMAYSNPIRLESLGRRPGIQLPGSARIQWLPVRSLGTARRGWLPRSMVELDLTEPSRLQPPWFVPTSNGLASGNCQDEAVLHGLCEVIERHGLYLAEHHPESNQVPLAVEGLEETSCHDVLRRIRDAGMELSLWDLTWDIGVPVVYATLVGSDLGKKFLGSGCHPDPEIAVSRAVTEAIQSRLTHISGARDDLPHPRLGAWIWDSLERDDRPVPRRSFDQLPDLSTSSVAGDVGRVVEALAEHGYEPFVLDLEREELGVPVVSVFVPGLRIAFHG